MQYSGFYNLDNLKIKQVIEDNWQIIAKEVLNIKEEHMFQWHEKQLVKGGNWLMTPVHLLDVQFEGITNMLPNTTKLLNNLGCIISGISVLQPSTEIQPHSDDIYDDVLLSKKTYRMQLGIQIPKGCSISVMNLDGIFEEKEWEVGKILAFDSSRVHKAKNPSDENRIVLICDFVNQDVPKIEVDRLRNYYLSLYGIEN